MFIEGGAERMTKNKAPGSKLWENVIHMYLNNVPFNDFGNRISLFWIIQISGFDAHNGTDTVAMLWKSK